jgi:hypothetical protein
MRYIPLLRRLTILPPPLSGRIEKCETRTQELLVFSVFTRPKAGVGDEGVQAFRDIGKLEFHLMALFEELAILFFHLGFGEHG